MCKIFCYGTLKNGMTNHHILGDSKLIKKTKTIGRYEMISFGNFSGVIEYNNNYHIIGEVYNVSDDILQSIDCLECNGSMFDRKVIHVEDMDELVYIYFVNTYHDFLKMNDNYYDNIEFECLTQEWKPYIFDFPIK